MVKQSSKCLIYVGCFYTRGYIIHPYNDKLQHKYLPAKTIQFVVTEAPCYVSVADVQVIEIHRICSIVYLHQHGLHSPAARSCGNRNRAYMMNIYILCY